MKLVKKYTTDGIMWVDADQLADFDRFPQRVWIYNHRGERLSQVARTKKARFYASFGVHRNNLFDSRTEAIAASNAFYATLNGAKS